MLAVFPPTKGEQDKSTQGRKYDQGKTDWALMPWGPLNKITRILMMGACKYNHPQKCENSIDSNARSNWKKVDNPKIRYFNALMRHLTDWAAAEWGDTPEAKWDTDSGLNVLYHAGCDLLFLIWFDDKENDGKEEKDNDSARE